MTQTNENQPASGSLPEELEKIMLNGARTPEENKKRKAELDFAAMKNRIIGRERHLEEMKERTRRKLRGEIDDE